MTQFVPSEDSDLLPTDFDLGQIFIGRDQQLDFFHIYLARLCTFLLSNKQHEQAEKA